MKVNVYIAPFFAGLIFLCLTGLASFSGQPAYLLLPFVFLLLLLLAQKPAWAFYLLLATIPWSVEYNFTPALGTDLPDEPLMLLVSFFVLVLAAHHRRPVLSDLHPLLFLLALGWIWTAFTVFTSSHPEISFKYLLAKSWYLLAFAAAPLLLIKADLHLLKRSATILVSSMFLFVLLALYRHGQLHWTFENINEALRPFYRNHVNYSALLVFTIPLQIALFLLASSRRQKIWLGVVIVITLAALYLSFARGAWVALPAGGMGYWLLRKKWLTGGFFMFLLLMALSFFYLKSNDRYLQLAPDYQTTIFHKDFREHLVATYRLKDVSTAERFYRWVAAVRMVPDSWRNGQGPGSFNRQYRQYTLPAFKTWVSSNREQSTVHNYFLLLLVEQGVLGLLLFLLLLAAAFYYAQSIYHRAADRVDKTIAATVAVLLVMEGVINFLSDMIETDKAGSVFYLCMAVLVILDNRQTAKLRHHSTI